MKTHPGDVSNNEILQELRVFAKQTNERFERIDERFDKMDERFEKIDQRFEKIDQRFEKIDQRFEKIDERMDRIEGRIDGFEASVQSVLEAINEESTLNNKRFASIEKRMVTKDYLDEKLADLRFAPVLSSVQGK